MTTDRVALIHTRLADTFDPIELDVVDESHLHVGHAGARDGRGHFRVRIKSATFEGRTTLQTHRLIYAALGDLMESDIHALSITASPA